jgi:hypothetical protein
MITPYRTAAWYMPRSWSLRPRHALYTSTCCLALILRPKARGMPRAGGGGVSAVEQATGHQSAAPNITKTLVASLRPTHPPTHPPVSASLSALKQSWNRMYAGHLSVLFRAKSSNISSSTLVYSSALTSL